MFNQFRIIFKVGEKLLITNSVWGLFWKEITIQERKIWEHREFELRDFFFLSDEKQVILTMTDFENQQLFSKAALGSQ